MALSNNRINTTLAAADATAMRAAIDDIVAAFTPYSRPLTIGERQSLPKIQSNNKAFVELAITLAQANPQFLPAFYNVNDMMVDFTLHTQLQEFKAKILSVLEMIEDLSMLSGSEAYMGSLSFYDMAKAAKKAGVAGADSVVDQLKTRFENQGGGRRGTNAVTLCLEP